MFSKNATKKSIGDCSGQIERLSRALIEAEAVVIGAGTHAEIWSEENWDVMENELNDEALSEAFSKLGF